MTARSFTIFIDKDAWSVAAVQDQRVDVWPLSLCAEQSDWAGAAAQLLQDKAYAGEPVTLALPSAWCLCAALSAADVPRRNRQQTLLYRLEEHLPIPAEDVVADFVQIGDTAMGLAVMHDRLAPIIQTLESHHVNVAAICPAALLAIEHLLAHAAEVKPDAVVWSHGQRTELLLLHAGQPRQWISLPARDATAALPLKAFAATRREPLSLLVCGHDRTVADELSNHPDFALRDCGDATAADLLEHAARLADGVARTGLQPWFNLRRDRLAPADLYRGLRAPLLSAASAAIVLLVLLIGLMQYRSHQYDRLLGDVEAQQQAVFRQSFPGQAVPISVRMRLQAEDRRLGGLSGSSTELPAQPSALLTLAEVLRRLPSQMRYRILEIRVDPQRLYIEGQAKSHSDADRIAAALRKAQGFAVESPRTEQLPGQGIGFTLTATTAAAEPQPIRSAQR